MYLKKKELLEQLRGKVKSFKQEMDSAFGVDEYRFAKGKWFVASDLEREIQSGAFDADESEGTWKATAEVLGRENAQMNTEIQRLRAAAIRLHETINSFWQGDCEKADVVAAQSKLCDVLDSIGNHPKQVKPFQQRLLELTIEENKKIYNIPKGDENA